MPYVDFFFAQAKTSGVQRSVRRMPSIAQRAAEGCAATDGRPSGMPCVDFFCASKKSGVQRSVRRMPSIARRAAEGCAATDGRP